MVEVKRVLLTGASGYVGQHLIESLSTGTGAGEDLPRMELYCCYNDLSTFEQDMREAFGEEMSLSSDSKPKIRIQVVSGINFADPGYISRITNCCGDRFDCIVHLAALSSPTHCENHPDDAWKINCPVDLLSFKAPIIYLSTDQVYEGLKSFYSESDRTVPVNVYGRTKLAFERVLLRDGGDSSPLLSVDEAREDTERIPRAIEHTAAPNSVCLRSSLILGPPVPLRNGCRKGFDTFIQFISSRLESAAPTVYYTNEYRSVVHIKDVVRAILHFLSIALSNNEQKGSQVYNLGGTTRASRYDIALAVASQLKLDPASANGAERSVTTGGVASPPDISMDVHKLEAELGMAIYGLKQIIENSF
ncbi:hypothetical protein THAOC_31118 [Thalassiosira oceanica]|uniref:RmlD-like substrate binding domain-containing protein n=1 Tax=Thalassiosira oceanica TaxID=159749 RepID=K0RCD9_THAOC|nr:hypothetical protein THAOC_31118 [Thalassiosira oceanica]|eukprot:EJK49954.1 hypothetical protein THAOC_31118 [Thalassiosira oceanica]